MIRFLTIAVIMIMSVQYCNAQIVTANQVKSDVAQMLKAQYEKELKTEVDIKVNATQFANLQLPDGEIKYKIATSNSNKILPRDIKRIDVYVNKAFIKTLNLPVQTSIYKNVLVATDTINREQALTKECVTVKKIDVAMFSDYVLTEKMLEKDITTKKAFQKGEVIDKRFVKMRPDVQRNSDVRIFFVSNNSVMITIDGTAMADGMTGDYVNVENKNYKKVYNGKVIGENKVLVSI